MGRWAWWSRRISTCACSWGWNAVFAIAEETARGTQRSIQVFDQQGVAVHKVFLTEASDVRAWEPLVERLRAAEQDAVLALHEPRAPAAALVDAQIDAAALREGWAALKDTHHFHALLKKHGAQRRRCAWLAANGPSAWTRATWRNSSKRRLKADCRSWCSSATPTASRSIPGLCAT